MDTIRISQLIYTISNYKVNFFLPIHKVKKPLELKHLHYLRFLNTFSMSCSVYAHLKITTLKSTHSEIFQLRSSLPSTKSDPNLYFNIYNVFAKKYRSYEFFSMISCIIQNNSINLQHK